jgi:hypothetical protein
MNAGEYQNYLAERRASTPLNSLRSALYSREGVEATDGAIRRELRAWAVERRGTLQPGGRRTTIVFGTCASDAKRRAAAPNRLAEEMYDDVTCVKPIRVGWDDELVWPDFGGQ